MPLNLLTVTRTPLILVIAVTQTLAGDRHELRAAARPPAPAAADAAPAPVPDPATSAGPRLALHFTAPLDPSGAPAVRRYEFLQVDPLGNSTMLRGYADSTGDSLLTPHASGTRETVWLAPTEPRLAKTIFVLSHGTHGTSARSNGVPIAAVLHPHAYKRTVRTGRVSLGIPVVASSSPPAAAP